ncbi:MAG: hypothetical protein JNN15_17600, partial [Blastocatellia bacterium]|nr:hypothetical protein [Blastocatellia bacterium]
MDLIVDAGYLVDRCIESLGGRTALQNISSFYSRTELSTPQGKSYLDTYRAAGGLIRFEERTEEGLLTVTIISGLSGIEQIFPKTPSEASQKKSLCSQEVEQIRRSVKLYPRNFLIHADEYSYALSKMDNTYILH